MLPNIRVLTLAAAGAIIWAGGAKAATDATGIWFDHNGRGAVEIAPCASGKGLCGFVVHIKESKNADRCGLQILGNVTPDGGGWIYSPERGRKYPVALTRLSDGKLRVVGNAGSFFTKTFTWNRAPDDVARCGESTAAAPAKAEAEEPKVAATAPAAEPAAEPKPERTERTPAATRSLGASSGSMALLGAPPPRQRVAAAETAAAPEAEEKAAAPVTKEPQPAAKEPAAQEKTASAPAEAPEDESFAPGRKRDCKFKIPYVGRVISVPCRD